MLTNAEGGRQVKNTENDPRESLIIVPSQSITLAMSWIPWVEVAIVGASRIPPFLDPTGRARHGISRIVFDKSYLMEKEYQISVVPSTSNQTFLSDKRRNPAAKILMYRTCFGCVSFHRPSIPVLLLRRLCRVSIMRIMAPIVEPRVRRASTPVKGPSTNWHFMS